MGGIKGKDTSDKTKSDELKKRGTKQVEKFSWEKMAKETLKIYKEVASK